VQRRRRGRVRSVAAARRGAQRGRARAARDACACHGRRGGGGSENALLASGGSLTEAARLLEAALQCGDAGAGGYEAWLRLGEARSVGGRERPAMQAPATGVAVAAATTTAVYHSGVSVHRNVCAAARVGDACMCGGLLARFPISVASYQCPSLS
jgi:hypothetical protein